MLRALSSVWTARLRRFAARAFLRALQKKVARILSSMDVFPLLILG
jgi:hypothetical protein